MLNTRTYNIHTDLKQRPENFLIENARFWNALKLIDLYTFWNVFLFWRLHVF